MRFRDSVTRDDNTRDGTDGERGDEGMGRKKGCETKRPRKTQSGGLQGNNVQMKRRNRGVLVGGGSGLGKDKGGRIRARGSQGARMGEKVREHRKLGGWKGAGEGAKLL